MKAAPERRFQSRRETDSSPTGRKTPPSSHLCLNRPPRPWRPMKFCDWTTPLPSSWRKASPKQKNAPSAHGALIEEATPSVTVDFQTLDHPPLESNPDAFERTCDRTATLSSLRRVKKALKKTGTRIALFLSPLPLNRSLSRAPPPEERQKSEIDLEPGTQMDFDEFLQFIGRKLGLFIGDPL